ncbi:POK18 protein, partial [Chaetorhynchus papuensis]|nr:POK18 protein [Chaetorhynchus papuensis]
DAPRFAFSVPTLNHAEPMKRYHWTDLPQGMCNSPTICQRVVDLTLQPVRCQFPEATMYHYMDNILLAAKDHSVLCSIQVAVVQAVQAAGLVVAPEKVQQQALWHYLGWKITQQTICPQPVKLSVKDNLTWNDLQKLLGSLNWLRPILGLSTELLHPLFALLRGDPNLKSLRQLTPDAKKALDRCAQALESHQGWRWDPDEPVSLLVVASKFQPFAVLFQWFPDDSDPLHVLEWLFLPHTATKTVWTIRDMFAQLIMKSHQRLQTLSDPHVIYVPANKENLSWLLSEDTNFQIALAYFSGQLSIHYPSHHLWM